MYPAWVDDYAIVSMAKPGLIINRAGQIFFCVQEVFRRYALDLNLKKGKTECMFMVTGAGSLAVQRDLASIAGNSIQRRGCDGNMVDLALPGSLPW